MLLGACTKVVLESRQFSSSSSTKVVITTKSPVLSFQLHRLLRVLNYRVASSHIPAPQMLRAWHEICTWRFTKCCACHEICAGAQPTPDDARAYIRPSGKQQSAAPATKSAPVPSRRQTTPGRTSDPLVVSVYQCVGGCMLLGACTKVVLESRQFSSSSSPDTPRTKVALQSRQFSASSSTDCSAY